jgi:AraC-like DNA-binding protein
MMTAVRGPSSHRLTARQFKTAKAMLRMGEQRLEAARLVLVDGKSMQDIAERYGWSRQSVYTAVRSVLKAWDHCAEVIKISGKA